MKIGDIITLKKGATYSSGKSIPSWVLKKTLYYRGIADNGKDIVFSILKSGAITGTVKPEFVNELAKDQNALGQKLRACLDKIESLPEYKELEKLL